MRQGIREILGFWIGDSESQQTWSAVFTDLKDRGLTGVDLVVSDDHRGLRKAIEQHFQGASWQRCQTHLTRNVLEAAPKSMQRELHGRLRSLFEAPDRATVDTLWEKLVQDFGERAGRALTILEEGLEDALAVLQLPEPLRPRLRTTNGVERLNAEIRRRERVIRIFPNRESAIRLLGALLLEQHEAWTTGPAVSKPRILLAGETVGWGSRGTPAIGSHSGRVTHSEPRELLHVWWESRPGLKKFCRGRA
ncbi:transposase, mutator type [Sulfobacillus acidophilus TPY]|nr:transposase, mutator type [Sulfobacillus acidophilus TPY]